MAGEFMARRVVGVLSGLAAVGLLAGCGASGAGTSSDSTSVAPGLSPSPSAGMTPSASASGGMALPVPWTSQTGSPAQQAAAVSALAAYRGMWADLATIGQSLDGWKNPELGAHLDDKPLIEWSQQFADSAKLGEVSTGAPLIDPRVVRVDTGPTPGKVEIADCFDNSTWPMVYAATHKPVDSKPGTRERTEALVTLGTDGYWRVTQQVFGNPGSC
jgi:hypothetical protein